MSDLSHCIYYETDVGKMFKK